TGAEWRPTAWSHLPEMPTTCPLLLIATAALVVSPGSGSSCSISISSLSPSLSFFRFQMTATNWKTCGASHPCGSRTEVSAHPTTCLRLLAPAAKLLFPPNGGSFFITLSLSSHTNPRHFLPKRKGPLKRAKHLHRSPCVSASSFWEMPTIMPLLFSTGHPTLLFGPPGVPRGISPPSRNRAASRLWSPATRE